MSQNFIGGNRMVFHPGSAGVLVKVFARIRSLIDGLHVQPTLHRCGGRPQATAEATHGQNEKPHTPSLVRREILADWQPLAATMVRPGSQTPMRIPAHSGGLPKCRIAGECGSVRTRCLADSGR